MQENKFEGGGDGSVKVKSDEAISAEKQPAVDSQKQALADKQGYPDELSKSTMPDGTLSADSRKKAAYKMVVDAANAAHAQAAKLAKDTLLKPDVGATGPASGDPASAKDPSVLMGPDIIATPAPAGTLVPPVPAKDPTTILLDPGIVRAAPLAVQWGVMERGYEFEPVAIALSGGGTIGDFELGALDFIYNSFLGSPAGIDAGFSRSRVDIATGASVGAVNAGAIAQGGVYCLSDLKAIWFGMEASEDFYILNPALQTLIGDGDYGNLSEWVQGIIGALVPGYPGSRSTGHSLFDLPANVRTLYEALVAQPSIMTFGTLGTTAREIESYWSPGGPGLRGASVAVACDFYGRRIVFARAYDDMLYVRWQHDSNPISASTRWSRWTPLGGPISSDPVAYVNGELLRADNPPRVGVLARQASEEQYGGRMLDGSNDILRVDPNDPNYFPFMAWENVPLPAGRPSGERYSSQATIIARAPQGRVMAFCRDENRRAPTSPDTYNRSYFSQWDGDHWGGWTVFGHNNKRIAGNITGCSYSSGTLELFARTETFGILYSFTPDNGTPGDWVDWQGEATSDVLVVLTEDPDTMIDVFWRGTDGRVWTRRKFRNEWGSQRDLGGLITSNLSFGRNFGDGICTIFARGLDDNLYAVRQPAARADWPPDAWSLVGAPPDLKLVADPHAFAGPSDGVEVYVVASDRAVWTIRQEPDGTYGPWISLGGNIWTGMQLRMGTVALETGEDRYVDETGRFAGTLEPIVSSDGDMRHARSQGALAACAAPGFFPPVPLNGKTWVDGGMRHGLPVGAAIAAGARRVIAIATVPTVMRPATRILPRNLQNGSRTLSDTIATTVGQLGDSEQITNYRDAGILDVVVRSFVEVLVDATSWSALYPDTRWPVPAVWAIQQTFKTHEGATVDPGLIRINYAYGWMRAFDILVASEDQRMEAVYSTDMIINLRLSAWKAEARFREAYLLATWGGMPVYQSSGWPIPVAQEAASLAENWLREARGYKEQLGSALSARQAAGFPLDPESPNWMELFERFAVQKHWGPQWATHVATNYLSPFWECRFTALDHSVHVVEARAAPSLAPA